MKHNSDIILNVFRETNGSEICSFWRRKIDNDMQRKIGSSTITCLNLRPDENSLFLKDRKTSKLPESVKLTFS